jgi:hypothetical protein
MLSFKHVISTFYTWFSFFCLGKTSNLTILADLSEQFMRLEWNIIFTKFPGRGLMNQDIAHTSVRIGVADSFLLVVYSYRIKIIPNTWTFNIIIFDNYWNCINFGNYLKFLLNKENWPFQWNKWQSQSL